jgi:chorismate dehydratase
METLKIAAVSYLNTFPFVFGIKTSGELDDIELQLHVPSVCASKLRSGEVDLALVPAGALPEIPGCRIITDFCIGAEADVKTVLLLSRKPVEEITAIHLDADSRTSVALAKILAREHWKIDPEWISLAPGKASAPADIESLVAIGDKTFRLAPQFPFAYDLAGEWIRFTGLPFVFAVWATCRDLPEGFLARFNKALEYGITRRYEIPEFFKNQIPKGVNALEYLENNISYNFNEQKQAGLSRYLYLLKNIY